VGEDIVGDDERTGFELRACKREEGLVVVLLSVQENDVEDVVDRRQGLEGVAFPKLDPLLEAGILDVPAPSQIDE